MRLSLSAIHKTFILSIKILIVWTLLFPVVPTHCANIIFDIGGVLIQTKSTTMARQIGMLKFLKYILTFNNPFAIRKKLFDVLGKIEASDNNKYNATDEKGNKLPNILCDWLTNKKDHNQITKQIKELANKNPQIFSNKSEMDLIISIIHVMFSPESMVKSANINQESLKFIKKCKKQGHNIYILSNFESQSFALIQKKYPELFNLFPHENIIISGNVKVIKPDPDIYTHLLLKHNLDPQNCIFFDDQEININAATALGIHAVHCPTQPTYRFMCKELDKFNVIIKKTNCKRT